MPLKELYKILKILSLFWPCNALKSHVFKHSPPIQTNGKRGLLPVVFKLIEPSYNRFGMNALVGQNMTRVFLILDSGSSNIWVDGSDETGRPVCRSDNHKDQVNVTFGSGILQGSQVHGPIEIRPLKFDNFSYFCVTKKEPFDHSIEGKKLFDKIDFQGLLGIGVSGLAKDVRAGYIWGNYPGEPITLELPSDESLSRESKPEKSAGQLILGDPTGRINAQHENWIRFPDVNMSEHWELQLTRIELGGSKICCDDEAKVVIDSGSSGNAFSVDLMTEIVDLLNKTNSAQPIVLAKNETNNLIYGECDEAQQQGSTRSEILDANFPSFKYYVGSEIIEMRPSEYFTYSHDKKQCRLNLLGLKSNHKLERISLGLPFLRKYIVQIREDSGGRGEVSKTLCCI